MCTLISSFKRNEFQVDYCLTNVMTEQNGLLLGLAVQRLIPLMLRDRSGFSQAHGEEG